MVRMFNGIKTIEIPEGAVNIYKNMGFWVDDEENSGDVVLEENAQEPQTSPDSDTNSGNDEFAELLSKPISQWDQEEVKEFAAAKGIDVSSATSLKQARAIVKKAIEEQEKSFMGE